MTCSSPHRSFQTIQFNHQSWMQLRGTDYSTIVVQSFAGGRTVETIVDDLKKENALAPEENVRYSANLVVTAPLFDDNHPTGRRLKVQKQFEASHRCEHIINSVLPTTTKSNNNLLDTGQGGAY